MRRATVARVMAVAAALAVVASCKLPMDAMKSGSGTSSGGMAAPITLEWDPVNGESAGYRLYLGSSSGHYSTSLDVGPSPSCVVSMLKKGQTYYFVVCAVETDGSQSGFSNEVEYAAVN